MEGGSGNEDQKSKEDLNETKFFVKVNKEKLHRNKERLHRDSDPKLRDRNLYWQIMGGVAF